MADVPGASLRTRLGALDPKRSDHAVALVDAILAEAQDVGASDVHLQPGADGVVVAWRVDGVLHPVTTLPASISPNVAARLKVLADLLTYRADLPQEGRIRGAAQPRTREAGSQPDEARASGQQDLTATGIHWRSSSRHGAHRRRSRQPDDGWDRSPAGSRPGNRRHASAS